MAISALDIHQTSFEDLIVRFNEHYLLNTLEARYMAECYVAMANYLVTQDRIQRYRTGYLGKQEYLEGLIREDQALDAAVRDDLTS